MLSQVITSLLLCGKWLFSNLLIMQIRWVTTNRYFSAFLVVVPHFKTWTIFHASLAWAFHHFYLVFWLVFIFLLILCTAPITELLPCCFFTCCFPGSTSFPLSASAFHWDWDNTSQWTWLTLSKALRGLYIVFPDYCVKTLRLFLHWTDKGPGIIY